jgi:hypothetical protein
MPSSGTTVTRLSFCCYCVGMRLRHVNFITECAAVLDPANIEDVSRLPPILTTGYTLISLLQSAISELVSTPTCVSWHGQLQPSAGEFRKKWRRLDFCSRALNRLFLVSVRQSHRITSKQERAFEKQRSSLNEAISFVRGQWEQLDESTTILLRSLSRVERDWHSLGRAMADFGISQSPPPLRMPSGPRLDPGALLRKYGVPVGLLCPPMPDPGQAKELIGISLTWLPVANALELGIERLRQCVPAESASSKRPLTLPRQVDDAALPVTKAESRHPRKGEWWHREDEPRPPHYQEEWWLQGTKKDLSIALDMKRGRESPDDRVLEARAKNGTVWVVRLQGQLWVAYFKSRAIFQRAKARLDQLPPPPKRQGQKRRKPAQ